MFFFVDLNFRFENMMTKKKYIGFILRQKRKTLGLKLDAVTIDTKISKSCLSNIENGKSNYTIDILEKLLSYYNMTIEIGNK